MITHLVSDQRIASEAHWRSIAQARNEAMLAKRDAQRACLVDLPDPAEQARYLPLELVEGLMLAERNKTYGWMVPERYAAQLRRHGLVGFGKGKEGRGVTAYGWAVRLALKAMDG